MNNHCNKPDDGGYDHVVIGAGSARFPALITGDEIGGADVAKPRCCAG